MAAVRAIRRIVTEEPDVFGPDCAGPLEHGPPRLSGIAGGDDVARAHCARSPNEQSVPGLERGPHAVTGDGHAFQPVPSPPERKGARHQPARCRDADSSSQGGSGDWALNRARAITCGLTMSHGT